MRILSSGLLLGAGVVAAVYGVKVQGIEIEVNQYIVMGLALMSLGLFALRVNVKPDRQDLPPARGPEEFYSDK